MRGRNKILKRLILSTLGLLLFITILQVSAQDYELTLVNTDYSKIKEETIGQELVVKYDIMVTLANRGNISSDQITLKLTDDEDFSVTEEYIFDAMETKTFIFEEYPLSGTGNHILTITYGPTNTSIQKTNANSGTETITIEYENTSSNDTPFVQPFYLLSILLIIGIFIKNKNRD